MKTSDNILLWLKIIRPQTLAASICPVLVGFITGGIEKTAVAAATLLCALSLQILSNLINDYYDFKRGADKKGRAGFQRALAEGLVTERQMRAACFIALAVALVLGLFLVISGGWPILAIGLTAILFAWLYTATDHSLSYLGIADIFVFLYYGVIATMGAEYLQTGIWTAQAFWAGGACGLISMCVLITNNLRDIESDRAAGKKTFPVRFGKRAGEAGYLAVILLIPLFDYMAFGLCSAMLTVIPGIALFTKVLRSEGSQYNLCLMLAGILNITHTLLCLV